MAKKIDFDFKQFLLQKGERVGLIVAGSLAVLLLILGVFAGLGKSSPLKAIDDNAQALDRKVAGTTPKDPPPPPEKPTFVKGRDPESTSFIQWLLPFNMENKGRRNPQVPNLLNGYQVDVLRVPVRVIEYTKNGSMQNLQSGPTDTNINPAEIIRPTRMVVITAAFPYQNQLKTFQTALRLKKLRELTELPEFMGFDVYRWTQTPDGRIGPRESLKLEGENAPFVSLVSSLKEVAPLEPNLVPVAFNGLVMPLPPLADIASYPPVRIKGLPGPSEKEPAAEQPGGAMKVFAKKWDDLPEEWQKQLSGQTAKVFNADGGLGKGQNQANNNGQQPMNVVNPGEKGKKNKKKSNENCLVRFVDIDVRPGHTYYYCLVIRVKNPNADKPVEMLASPTSKDIKLLRSGFNYPPPAYIPYDVEYYAVDELALLSRYDQNKYKTEHALGADFKSASNDLVAIQVHRWVDHVPGQANRNGFNLGADLIAERLLVRRGEQIGSKVTVEVPEWVQTEGQFKLPPPAQGAKGKKNRGMEINFSAMTDPEFQRPAILVDFDGGKQSTTLDTTHTYKDETDSELLVLTPDGKLAVRTERLTDRSDKTEAEKEGVRRHDRYMKWKRWIGRLNGLKDVKGKKDKTDDKLDN